MLADQPTYSARQKRALRSLQRALDSARHKADRLLDLTGQRRRITIGITSALSSLDQKLRDAEHYLESARPMVKHETSQHISSSAADVAFLLNRLINTIIREGRNRLSETVGTVSSRLLSAYRDVSHQVADLKRPKKTTPVDQDMRTFLDGIKSRGWHVPTKDQEGEDLRPDDISEAMLRQAQRPESDLLDPEDFAGLVRFPVVLCGSHISRAAASACLAHEANYTVRSVFGRYIMIPDMVLMGVRSEAIRVQESRHEYLDHDKFNALLPWMRNQSEWHEAILQDAVPVLQLRRYGGHYYCPVVPRQALQTRFELGEWSMLIDAN